MPTRRYRIGQQVCLTIDRDERLRRIVRGNRRNAALKAWDTRMMNEFRRARLMNNPRPAADVDVGSCSVARIIHGGTEEDEHGLDIEVDSKVAEAGAAGDA